MVIACRSGGPSLHNSIYRKRPLAIFHGTLHILRDITSNLARNSLHILFRQGIERQINPPYVHGIRKQNLKNRIGIVTI